MRYTLKKQEILRNKKKIKELFTNGSSFFLYPYKFIYQINTDGEKPVEVLFSVPVKRFGKAVDRNKIRRRMREAFRLNKQLLIADNQGNFSITLSIIYIGKSKLSFSEMGDKLKEAFIRLHKMGINKSI